MLQYPCNLEIAKGAEFMNQQELEFAIFCIESLAEETGRKGNEIYKLITDETDVLDNYLIPGYETLHTQGREYIVRELLEVIRERDGKI